MPAAPFNAMHAAVDPRGVLVRDFLATAGEEHGRDVMALAHDRMKITDDAAAAAVVALLAAEADRMATVYVEAGCSRRQVRAFVRAFYRGAAARNVEAMALLAWPHDGSA